MRHENNNLKATANKGFSLVELIIVIAIMAVLVGVLAPQFIKYVESSRQSTDIDTVANYRTAVEAYVTDEMSKGHTCDNVDITWASGKVVVSGGCSLCAVATYLDDLGINEASLKSDGWDGGSAIYNSTTYKWSTAGDTNAKKPSKDMISAFPSVKPATSGNQGK